MALPSPRRTRTTATRPPTAGYRLAAERRPGKRKPPGLPPGSEPPAAAWAGLLGLCRGADPGAPARPAGRGTAGDTNLLVVRSQRWYNPQRSQLYLVGNFK